jgi:hypothetical protein
VQLVDDQGQPIAGAGVCVKDPGKEQGEPCDPTCKTELVCVSHGQAASFCRQKCTDQSQCAAYKMVCVPLSDQSASVCVPGGSTTGPKEGESCAAAEAYCLAGLICDPASKNCVVACNAKNDVCQGKGCVPLTDPATSILVGYGCK